MTKIKQGWKKLKGWQKGGIIGLIIGLIFSQLFQLLESKIYYYTLGLPFTLTDKLLFSLGLRDERLAYSEIIFGLLIYALAGMIVGLFFQKYEKEND